MKILRFLFLAVSALAVLSHAAQPGESYADFTDDGGWCWFSDPRAVSRGGKTYTGWVTEDGSIQAAEVEHASGKVTTVTLHEKYERDDHDNPSFLFRADGNLMAFYSKHCGPEMNVRVTSPADFGNWGPETVLDISPKPRQRKNITYSNPVMLSEDGNTIHLFWRGDEWKPMHSKSTDGGKTWSPGRNIVSRQGAGDNNRPYMKITSNGWNEIHIVFTDGHPRDEEHNSIYYACYRDGVFYKADGTRIAGEEELPFAPEKADLVYDARPTGERAWVHDVAYDKENHPVIAYARYPSETDHRYHYARWNGGAWTDTELCAAGGWFPQTPSGKTEREPHYSGGLALDPADPGIVYLSRPVGGVREIEKWTSADLGKTWKSEPVTSGSQHDNIRPCVVRNAAPDGPSLLWMNLSGHYIHYTDFRCSIKMDRPAKAVHPAALSDAIEPKAVLSAMERVADWQLDHPSKHKTTDWTQGAGYTGIMALAGISGNGKYRDAMLRMGEANEWKLGPDTYSADDHVVGQTYAELYLQSREPKMIAPMRAVFDHILANPREGPLDFKTPGNQDRWSWCDSLFMAPPAWMRLYAATGDIRYLDLAVNHWWRTSDYLYDKDEHLFYRDSTYFEKREVNGSKVFWGRGNGWVMGGLVRMLQYLPSDHPSRPRFEAQFKDMAAKLLACQQSDGLWRASLLDPAGYPLKETSSSGFYAYAFAWGVNQGLLDRGAYEPAVRKAWSALIACVRNDGKLTHVQPIGTDPRKFPDDSTEVYGTGAFLLAGSEIHRMAVPGKTKP
jgi:rhamnogalacturonyl hydrolase YesR